MKTLDEAIDVLKITADDAQEALNIENVATHLLECATNPQAQEFIAVYVNKFLDLCGEEIYESQIRKLAMSAFGCGVRVGIEMEKA